MITFGSPQALEILAKQRILERWQGHDSYLFFVIMVYCGNGLVRQLINLQNAVEIWGGKSYYAEENNEPQEILDETERKYCGAVNASEKVKKDVLEQIPDEYKELVTDCLDSASADDMRKAKIAYRELLEQYKKG